MSDHVPQYDLPRAFRRYECMVCGHKDTISTNHTGTCFHFCNSCSWKMLGPDLKMENSMHFGGHIFRRFKFVGEFVD